MARLNLFLKRSIQALLALVILGIFYLNIKLYYHPSCIGSVNQETVHQLNYLKKEMANGAAQDMQRLFPEGYVFMHGLYGLTWYDIAKQSKPENELNKEAVIEINKSVAALDSEAGRRVFTEDLPLPYGAYYNGWTTYLMGRSLELQSINKDEKSMLAFKNNCDKIIAAYKSSNSPFLESYKHQTWPADNILCLAAISLHDRIFPPIYENEIQDWLQKIKENAAASGGLIPHSVFVEDGRKMEAARGSSQSLMLAFLPEIDSLFAKQQFQLYKERFLDKRLGLPGIREYPKGTDGNGDIDSGPVIWDIGGAASIVGIRTMSIYGDIPAYIGLRNSVEAFGMPNNFGKGKKYIFGILPMADVFIAWSNAVPCQNNKNTNNWRWKFHLLSGLLIVALGLLAIKI